MTPLDFTMKSSFKCVDNDSGNAAFI
jgi:hypothetical protein